MDGRFSRATLSALAAALLAAGCAAEGERRAFMTLEGEFLAWRPEAPEDRRLREQAEALQGTIGEAGLIGAVFGGTVGGLLGGGQGAGAGAQLGRLLAAGAGAYVSQLQVEYATAEAQLEALSADIAATNETIRDTIGVMEQVAATSAARLATLRQAVGTAASEQAALRREAGRAETRLALMQRAIAGAERREATLREAQATLVTPASLGYAGRQVAPGLTLLADRIAAMRRIAERLAAEL